MAAPAMPTTTNTPTTAPVLEKKPEPDPPLAAPSLSEPLPELRTYCVYV